MGVKGSWWEREGCEETNEESEGRDGDEEDGEGSAG